MPLCPHCLKPLPNAAARTCLFCHRPVAPVGTARPAMTREASTPTGTGPVGDAVPWEERDRLGWLTALYETTRAVLAQPSQLFSRVRPDQMGAVCLYGILMGTLGYLALVVQMFVITLVTPDPNRGVTRSVTEALFGFLVMAAMTPVGASLVLFVEAGVTHLFLLLFKGADRGFEATLAASAYSRATWVLFAIPLCGCGVAVVWFVVARIIGLAQTQRISTGKSAAAVLLPNVLCSCLAVGLQVLIFGSILGLAVIGALAGQP